MKKLLFLAVLSAALTSCAGRKEEAASPRLKRIVETLYSKPPCAAVIPEHWSPSWPVPAVSPGGSGFKLLFYPVVREGPELRLSAPLGQAVFTGDGRVSSCTRAPGPEARLSGPLSSKQAAGYSPEQMKERSDRLYALSEEVGMLFSAQSPPGPGQAPLLREYGGLFRELAEPPLLPHYYRLQPEFWDWLKAAGAPSLTSAD